MGESEKLRKRIAERERKIDKAERDLDVCINKLRSLSSWQARDRRKLEALEGAP